MRHQQAPAGSRSRLLLCVGQQHQLGPEAIARHLGLLKFTVCVRQAAAWTAQQGRLRVYSLAQPANWDPSGALYARGRQAGRPTECVCGLKPGAQPVATLLPALKSCTVGDAGCCPGWDSTVHLGCECCFHVMLQEQGQAEVPDSPHPCGRLHAYHEAVHDVAWTTEERALLDTGMTRSPPPPRANSHSKCLHAHHKALQPAVWSTKKAHAAGTGLARAAPPTRHRAALLPICCQQMPTLEATDDPQTCALLRPGSTGACTLL